VKHDQLVGLSVDIVLLLFCFPSRRPAISLTLPNDDHLLIMKDAGVCSQSACTRAFSWVGEGLVYDVDKGGSTGRAGWAVAHPEIGRKTI
jgi:hypothetical protein